MTALSPQERPAGHRAPALLGFPTLGLAAELRDAATSAAELFAEYHLRGRCWGQPLLWVILEALTAWGQGHQMVWKGRAL